MAYNKATDTSAGYISRQHQELLRGLMKAQKRTKRAVLEYLIEQASNKE